MPKQSKTPSAPAEGLLLVSIPLDSISGAFMDRDIRKIDNLAASIQQVGLIEPIVVKQLGPDAYEIIAGRRRVQAVKKLGWPTVPAVIKDGNLSDDTAVCMAISENVHRLDMSPVEKSARIMIDLDAEGIGIELRKPTYLDDKLLADLAVKYNMPEEEVVRLINLSLVDSGVEKLVHAGKVTVGAALLTLNLSNEELKEFIKQASTFKGVVYPSFIRENMGHHNLSSLSLDSKLDPECQECQFRGAMDPDLFEPDPESRMGVEGIGEDACTNTNCFEAKEKAIKAALDEQLAKLGVKAPDIQILAARELRSYNIYPRAGCELKDPTACLKCSNGIAVVMGKSGPAVYCAPSCSNLKVTKEAKEAKKETKAAAGGQQEAKPKTPLKVLVEQKLTLMMRKRAMTRIQELLNDPTPEMTGLRVLSFVLESDHPRRFIGDKRFGQLLAWGALEVMGEEILARQKEPLADLLRRRIDHSGVDYQNIDLQFQILTGIQNFCLENHELALQGMGKKSTENYEEAVKKGWLAPWQHLKEEGEPEPAS